MRHDLGPLALALTLALALGGCIRVGPGDDLDLVCEEKMASPRKAYDVGYLVAQTKVEGTLGDTDRVAMLEAARQHVIAPGGRAHSDFAATLAPAGLRDEPGTWVFDAIGGSDREDPDVYRVFVWREADAWVAGAEPGEKDLIRPPASIAKPAWRAANALEEVRSKLPNGSFEAEARWDPAIPSCVRLTYANAQRESVDIVVNVVQSRVVLI